MFHELDNRSKDIFRQIVESYIQKGDPIGSRSLSKTTNVSLSPASVRNVMADLEDLGLIYAPHTSAGRLPTEQGLRLFVDNIMEVGTLSAKQQDKIRKQFTASDRFVEEDILGYASKLLSRVSSGAGLVTARKSNTRLKHIEFVRLEPTKALVVLVGENGNVENRVIDIPKGMPSATLVEAGNFLNHHVAGQTLEDTRKLIQNLRDQISRELDEVTTRLIEAGLAQWANAEDIASKKLIVHGRSNLLQDESLQGDLDRTRQLFDLLDAKSDILHLLNMTETGDGVRIFIGSENKLFSLSGSSLIVSPYFDQDKQIVGVLGIIGPTRLNYARIVPVLDYTAQLVAEFLDKKL